MLQNFTKKIEPESPYIIEEIPVRVSAVGNAPDPQNDSPSWHIHEINRRTNPNRKCQYQSNHCHKEGIDQRRQHRNVFTVIMKGEQFRRQILESR